MRAREAAVVALETGNRGRELLSGGDILGGGAMMLALSEGLFCPCAIFTFLDFLPGLLIGVGRGTGLG